MTEPRTDITELLKAWGAGDEEALHELTPLVYEQLHRAARRYMAAERPDHTLQATALVHEAYIRLVDRGKMDWQDRLHFFAVSAQLMRRILIDFARAHSNQKRGGDFVTLTLDEAAYVCREPHANVLALDEALKALAALDSRKARMVELRFFGGLSVQETAAVLKVSEETVTRDWRLSKAWLLKELSAASSA